MKPLIAVGESAEDAAVFDDAALNSLAGELAAQANAVRDSLAAVAKGNDKRAANLLSEIPRKSPYSQWRLFVGGLIDWYSGDAAKADESFSRLDQDRRPARIAATLVDARKKPVATVESRPNTAFARAVLIERSALREARDIVSKKEFVPPAIRDKVLIGSERLAALIDFSRDHQTFEPRLVAALGEEAINRLSQMTFSDLFEIGIKSIPGPPHDPKQTLRSLVYYSKFDDTKDKTERLFQRYLTNELPSNQQLSPALRDAIAAQLYFGRAMKCIARSSQSPFARFGFDPYDDNVNQEELIVRSLESATQSFPKFERAHQERVNWIREHVDDSRLAKVDKDDWEQLLFEAMRDWSEGLPENIEPRLWLVDHYLENEELESAQPHVDWLGKSRHSDPRVRATPWKWCLLEAMRLCRRKAWLGQVDAQLDQAESCWPGWLSKDWLGYLRAALALRQGNVQEYQQQRTDARAAFDGGDESNSDLADAVMMLAAAQRMRVPSADLKPLRVPVDAAGKITSELSSESLLLAGSFFYDLHRTGLLYPAYRMHGGKFADELLSRIQTAGRCKQLLAIEAPGWPAIKWLSARKMFTATYQLNFPVGLRTAGAGLDPDLTAALELQAILHISRHYRWPKQTPALLRLARGAVDKQADPFQRYWFSAMVSEGETAEAETTDWFGGSFGNRFERSTGGGGFGRQSDERDDDDDDRYGPNCDCDHCTRTRERLGVPHPKGADDLDEPDFPTMRLDSAEPPSGDSATQGSLFPELEPPPQRTPRPKPSFDAEPERRRNRPKNPMKKRKSR